MSFLFHNIEYLANDGKTRPVNEVNFRTASIDDDVITELNSDGSEGASITQTIISESCKSVFSKLNQINLSVDSCDNDNGSPPRSSDFPLIIIGLSKSAPTSTPEERVNSPTISTDVYENNKTNLNNNILEFVIYQISLLIVMPKHFIEFENDMKSLEFKNIYSY